MNNKKVEKRLPFTNVKTVADSLSLMSDQMIFDMLSLGNRRLIDAFFSSMSPDDCATCWRLMTERFKDKVPESMDVNGKNVEKSVQSMNVATAVECLRLMPKPFEPSKHIPEISAHHVFILLSLEGLAEISVWVKWLCESCDTRKGFVVVYEDDDDTIELCPKKRGEDVFVSGLICVDSRDRFDSEFNRIMEEHERIHFEDNKWCRLKMYGRIFLENEHEQIHRKIERFFQKESQTDTLEEVQERPALYRMTSTGLLLLNHAEELPPGMPVVEGVKILLNGGSNVPASLPSMLAKPTAAEIPVTDLLTTTVATKKPTGRKKTAQKKPWKGIALRDVLQIDSIITPMKGDIPAIWITRMEVAKREGNLTIEAQKKHCENLNRYRSGNMETHEVERFPTDDGLWIRDRHGRIAFHPNGMKDVYYYDEACTRAKALVFWKKTKAELKNE